MVNIQAAPVPERAAVRISLDSAAGVTDVIRADANGTRPVRLRSGALSGDGGRTLMDYEAALSGPVMYRLAGASGTAWTEFDGTAGPTFSLPLTPLMPVVAGSITRYEAERSSRSTFHDVIDRPAPMVTVAALGLRRGRITAPCESYAAARALVDLMETGHVVQFRQVENPGQDMYFYTERAALEADPENGLWNLDLEYREAGYPAGNISSPGGWTFSALAAAHPAFSALPDTYRRFSALTVRGA